MATFLHMAGGRGEEAAHGSKLDLGMAVLVPAPGSPWKSAASGRCAGLEEQHWTSQLESLHNDRAAAQLDLGEECNRTPSQVEAFVQSLRQEAEQWRLRCLELENRAAAAERREELCCKQLRDKDEEIRAIKDELCGVRGQSQEALLGKRQLELEAAQPENQTALATLRSEPPLRALAPLQPTEHEYAEQEVGKQALPGEARTLADGRARELERQLASALKEVHRLRGEKAGNRGEGLQSIEAADCRLGNMRSSRSRRLRQEVLSARSAAGRLEHRDGPVVDLVLWGG